MAKLLGWHVTVIRPPADIALAVAEADCDAAVVMNHHYDRDLEFLAAWLGSPVPFIGMLGPAHRTRRMLVKLATMGVALEGAEQRIRAPVGLDIGAETPEEIALAIVAEIKASISGRGGGPLRDRQSPIHDREVSILS